MFDDNKNLDWILNLRLVFALFCGWIQNVWMLYIVELRNIDDNNAVKLAIKSTFDDV